MSQATAKRVCVIGAGASGMSVLYHFHQLKAQGKEIPEIVCYDKQCDWGGLWKFSWETGEYFFGFCVCMNPFYYMTCCIIRTKHVNPFTQ